ncbi:hypothetical protein SAMN04489712_103188 [Thermomonospora echinospora]|uniref:Uncharacterized protein n=1 Tax=Thermomonospora echinospora TaxID=1992 RepID=A0A1H5XD03_9ACTN|nr:hypothetical protein [Thermomonospora echinospora]SEG09310.1 hypothetical protein SAMN04489712_103188 [Thermomonospora echinospora]
MNAWDDPERREELTWRREREPDRADGLAELIRATIDEDTRDLVFPGAMAERVIHGSRARRPWSRIHATILVGVVLASGMGVVSAAAVVPGLVSHGGEPTMTAPSTGAGPSAAPDPSRLVVVGYVPRGWRRVPLVTMPAGDADVRAWTVRYEPQGVRRQTLTVRVAVGRDGLTEVRRTETARGSVLRPYAVTVGRALTVPPVVVGRGRPAETRVYWEPRAGLLVGVRGVGVSSAEIRKVVSGLRLTA